MTKDTKQDKFQLMDKTVSQFIKDEFVPWKKELKKYWPSIDKMQDMYEFYKSETEKSPSKVSLNTPFSIVESMVARSNETKTIVSVDTKGMNGLEDVASFIEAIVKDTIDDKDIAAIHGPFRKRKESHFREYLVKGNAFSEDQWEYKTQIINGKKKVIADNPWTDCISYKSVIFNPSYQADNSPVYWVVKNVSYKDLKNNEYDEKTGRGLYTNLAEVKRQADSNKKLVDSDDDKVIIDGEKSARRVEPIELLLRWSGADLTIIADRHTIIRQATDPFKTGRHNLHISMNYKVIGRPYAYGEIDPIYKMVRAQDTIVNQNITSINKYLDPAMTYDPSDNAINVDQVMDVLDNGGLTPAKPNSIVPLSRNLPPSQAFQTVDSMQQSIERAARYSAYASGQTSQVTDKTKGTATGIQSLIKAAEPNYQIKLDDLATTYYTPVAMDYLKMIANLMSETDVRYTKLKGKSPRWVEATKNLMLGELNIEDLHNAQVIDDQEYQEFILDDDGEEIPDIKKTTLFDFDWLVNITLDNQAESDKQEKIAGKQQWFMQGIQLGLPMDIKKFHEQIGMESDIDNPEQYYLDNQGQPGQPEGQPADPNAQPQPGMPQGQPEQPPQPEPTPPPPGTVQTPGGQVHETGDLVKLFTAITDPDVKNAILETLGLPDEKMIAPTTPEQGQSETPQTPPQPEPSQEPEGISPQLMQELQQAQDLQGQDSQGGQPQMSPQLMDELAQAQQLQQQMVR